MKIASHLVSDCLSLVFRAGEEGNRKKEDMTQKKPIFTKAQTENKIKRRIQFGLQLILKIKEKYKTEINVQLTT